LFGAPDEECYIEQPLPQVQELIKQVLYEKLSSVGSQVIINALNATGQKSLVNAILAKSLTPQQAELLKQVSLDPKVAEALEQVKGRLLEGIQTASENFKDAVVPVLADAAGNIINGTLDQVKDAAGFFPGVDELFFLVDAARTGINAVEDAVDIGDTVKNAIAPVKAAMGQIDNLTTALNNAASSASSAANQASGAVAGTVANATSGVTGLSDQASSTVTSGIDAQVSGVSNNDTAKLGTNEQIKGGGSRTRRRIHKLSRRIERTLRRVQKKYGLQDKNSFLRRTLKRK
jgi:hypothetical protein